MANTLKIRNCYVNGLKMAVANYNNGTIALLHSTKKITAEDIRPALSEAGYNLYSYQYAAAIPSFDVAGIASVITVESIDWEGSKEYDARVAARVTRNHDKSGKNTGSAPAPAATTGTDTPATAATSANIATPDAFQVPAVEDCKILHDMINNMVPVKDTLQAWGASLSDAAMNGQELPAAPECVEMLNAFMPGISAAVETYKNTIMHAVSEHKEKQAKKEAERIAAEKAAAAAANGKTLITLSTGRALEVEGTLHKEFVTVAELVDRGHCVYLYGPAGTGKTYLAEQIAKAFGLPFYRNGKTEDIYNSYSGVMMPGSGFAATPLYNAATLGGLYFQDEADLSLPTATDWLQTAIDERAAMFNDGTGERKKFHKDFICLAAGNTPGLGPSDQYQYANALSPAFRARFRFVYVGYDLSVDEKAAQGDTELLDFMLACRAAVNACKINMPVSPREIKAIKELKEVFADDKIIEIALTKFLPSSQLRMVAAKINLENNRWATAFAQVAEKEIA